MRDMQAMATLEAALGARSAGLANWRSSGGVATWLRDRDHAWIASATPPTPHALRARSEDDLLALVAAAREHEDPVAKETARRAWNELVERDVDRVRALVRTWSLPGKDVRVAVQDRDDATQH